MAGTAILAAMPFFRGEGARCSNLRAISDRPGVMPATLFVRNRHSIDFVDALRGSTGDPGVWFVCQLEDLLDLVRPITGTEDGGVGWG